MPDDVQKTKSKSTKKKPVNKPLKRLQPRHKLFLDAVLQGMTVAAAWDKTQPHRFGKPPTAVNRVPQQARKVLSSKQGKEYIARVMDQVDAKSILSLEVIFLKLRDIINDEKTSVNNVIKAIETFAKLAGYNSADKVEVALKEIKIRKI